MTKRAKISPYDPVLYDLSIPEALFVTVPAKYHQQIREAFSAGMQQGREIAGRFDAYEAGNRASESRGARTAKDTPNKITVREAVRANEKSKRRLSDVALAAKLVKEVPVEARTLTDNWIPAARRGEFDDL